MELRHKVLKDEPPTEKKLGFQFHLNVTIFTNRSSILHLKDKQHRIILHVLTNRFLNANSLQRFEPLFVSLHAIPLFE